MSAELGWVRDLLGVLDELPVAGEPRPHWSQRQEGSTGRRREPDLVMLVRGIRFELRRFERENWFSQRLGYDCVDGKGEPETTIEAELDERLGKGHLTSVGDADWSLDDLCDAIEVYHDLAARPSNADYHSFMGCGFHPSSYSATSGRAVYRWRMNRILAGAGFGLRLADQGEDTGRITQVLPSGLDELAQRMAAPESGPEPEVVHAVALFRQREASRQDRRSAVVALARVLEQRRSLLKEHLFRKDEGALFQIANEFDVRHNDKKQFRDYDDAFLGWIFYWYLATIELTARLIERQHAADAF